MAVKVVVDSNLLVSALLTRDPRSPTVTLFRRAIAGEIAAHTSPFQLAELVDVLGRPKFRRSVAVEDALRLIEFIRNRFVLVGGRYDALDVVPRDARDNPIMAIGLEAEAHYLITDDGKHLLPLKVIKVAGHRPLQIVSLEDFDRMEPPRR